MSNRSYIFIEIKLAYVFLCFSFPFATGAAGIVFPHIDTPEQAAEAARRSRYACSGGDRSLSPSALLQGITDIAPPGMSHTQVADSHVAVICQIESQVSYSFHNDHEKYDLTEGKIH